MGLHKELQGGGGLHEGLQGVLRKGCSRAAQGLRKGYSGFAELSLTRS